MTPRTGTSGSAEAEFLALLDEERRALLSGEFTRLPELDRAKQACAMRYMAQPVRAPALLAALRRNQRLLGSALQGLAAVRSRLSDWERLSQRMETYGPDGQKTGIGHGPTGKIHRKL
ncbi:hypothetical protein [Alloyangia pacifica]|uniref:Flagellar protein FlgN n=1 Tax=Alloyangia pacifica TaxID=311180 RepID=A0A1I6U032_9RHOB|nr:hypothetical protein [Alloyangia pacifica]SDH31654.1 hypothetical protein SAMN04488245_10717 [Alloyangia pacifica]SFS94802.1 hypothetical protein SAMN04488050_10717 [Alloyangia pacifica]